jgi:dTDP-4-dehydrorhamnose 3,5-epimerase-like enzyme
MIGYRLIDLKTFTDSRGSLTPLELSEFINFPVKRVYTVHHNLTTRGGHAHIVEEELFFLASGKAVCALNNGSEWIRIEMEANREAIYVGEMIWHQFEDFSEDACLVALSSTNYNPSRQDYIEDFNQFLNTKS